MKNSVLNALTIMKNAIDLPKFSGLSLNRGLEQGQTVLQCLHWLQASTVYNCFDVITVIS